MRWVWRSLLFWAVSLPLFFIFGLPVVLDKVNDKARVQSFTQCQEHLQSQGMAGTPTALLKPAEADQYCHCVSDPITLMKEDLPNLLQKKPPERLNAAMKPVVEACNAALTQSINDAARALPQPRTVVEPDGTEIIHFN